MRFTAERGLAIAEAFYEAAFETGDWDTALESFAAATGSSVGELIAIERPGRVALNIMTNARPGIHEAFEASGGSDPSLNPRIGAGMRTAPLHFLAERNILGSPDAIRRDPHYQEFAIPWGIPYIGATVLERDRGRMVGLAVLRTEREGHISPHEERIFMSIAPQIRGAVRANLALGNESARVLQGMLDALPGVAVACYGDARVHAVSAAADDRLSRPGPLTVRGGRVASGCAASSRTLAAAIAAVEASRGRPDLPRHRTLVVRAADGSPAVVDLHALPARDLLPGNAPTVLLLVRGSRTTDHAEVCALLREAFGLTEAEADIASQLASGAQVGTIAHARGASVATVRTQVKSIFGKLDVTRQQQLVALVNRLR